MSNGSSVPISNISLGNTGYSNSIVSVFGGANPTTLSSFRGIKVKDTTSGVTSTIPSTGAVSMSLFAGKQKPPSTPPAPTGATTTGWDDTSTPLLYVTWTNATGATSYTIQLFFSTTTYVDGNYPTTPNYTYTNQQSGVNPLDGSVYYELNNHTYFFVRVFSVNSNGTSPAYSESAHRENGYH